MRCTLGVWEGLERFYLPAWSKAGAVSQLNEYTCFFPSITYTFASCFRRFVNDRLMNLWSWCLSSAYPFWQQTPPSRRWWGSQQIPRRSTTANFFLPLARGRKKNKKFNHRQTALVQHFPGSRTSSTSHDNSYTTWQPTLVLPGDQVVPRSRVKPIFGNRSESVIWTIFSS